LTRLALTGTTGFIGRRLLTHLAGLEAGAGPQAGSAAAIEVRAHSRRPLSGLRQPARLTVLDGALDDPATWARLLEGVDAVVHVAGAVRGRGPADFAINHRAVAALVAAANALPAPPAILLVSSLAARRPDISDYAHSKHAGEAELANLRAPVGCVLRPPAVYGPGDVEMLPLLRAMAAGLGVYPGSLDARVSLIHVDDLCRLVLAWLRAPCAGVTLEPDDGRANGHAWRDLHAEVAKVAGRRVHALRLPPALLRGAASLLALFARLGGPVPMLSQGKVRELTADAWVCSPMPVAVGDWAPRIELERGLRALLDADGDDELILA
jgi:uncharacterized protein YbjT (DUF2867 family)